MDNKGQAGMGIFLIAFVAVIVGLVLFQAIAGQVGTATTSATLVAGQYTIPAAGVTIDLIGQDLLSTPAVINRSGGEAVTATNYTIQEGVSATRGVKTIQMTGKGGYYASKAANVSYTYGPDGYINDSGGRAIAGIIIIFVALGIAVVALEPTLRSGVLQMMGK